ncbi:MAG TPA: hypothetical protein VGK17_24260 [Propionicimonas sp.]|jgi:hypothetical protein
MRRDQGLTRVRPSPDGVHAELLTWITDELHYDAAPVVIVDQDPDNHWNRYRPDRITRLAAAVAETVDVTAGG